MADGTGIQWTDATWNPIRGCSRVSEGCRNCYAEKVAYRFSGEGQPYEGLVTEKGRWNGEVMWVEEHIDDPLRWRKPRMVFVNSMSDMFHESLSFDQLATLFAVMAAAQRHTFQVLTKRPERARWFFEKLNSDWGLAWRECFVTKARHYLGDGVDALALAEWPLKNVWLGVSAEDRDTWVKRVTLLDNLPAAVRWVSAEPLLGDLGDIGPELRHCVDWLVVGGESGPGARRFETGWALDIVRQCREASVPCFVKQLGSKPCVRSPNGDLTFIHLADRKGGDPDEWIEDLRVRQWPT